MATPVGIYITGLGQSFNKQSVEKYALRFKNELKFLNTGVVYDVKSEKIVYDNGKEISCAHILKTENGSTETIYKIYGFDYHELLTEKFKSKNILIKSWILLTLVIRKFPQIFRRMFSADNYNRPYQTFYAFLILLAIGASITFLLPACIDLIFKFSITNEIIGVFNYWNIPPKYTPDFERIKDIGKTLVPVITFVLLIVPESKTIVTTMATEFACVDKYIRNGEQSQVILGNLDLFVDYISERENGSQIHFHCYSFGCILTIDHLFCLGNLPADNSQRLTKLLITIGNPYEFIKAYYPRFFMARCKLMDDKLEWMNIYSIADALATNFRKDANRGDAEFGLIDNSLIPKNFNFEVTSDRRVTLWSFLSLHSIRVHKCYWDSSPSGSSCVRLVVKYMVEKNYIKN